MIRYICRWRRSVEPLAAVNVGEEVQEILSRCNTDVSQANSFVLHPDLL